MGSAASSAELFERFQRGDSDAFAELMRAHMGIVRRVVSGFYREPFAQEEAMQEVWLHVYAKRMSLDLARTAEFPGWLATLARRRCLDLLRQPGAPTPVEDVEALMVDGDPQPDATLERQLKDAVDELKAKLDPQWASFFALHFVEGLGYDEIAPRLGISKLRCKYMKKVLIARARRHKPLMDALGRATASRGERTGAGGAGDVH